MTSICTISYVDKFAGFALNGASVDYRAENWQRGIHLSVWRDVVDLKPPLTQLGYRAEFDDALGRTGGSHKTFGCHEVQPVGSERRVGPCKMVALT